MFRIPLFRRNMIISDEGFTVIFVNRNVIRYEDQNVSLLVDIDGDGKRTDVLANSIRPALHSGARSLDADSVDRAERNVLRALEWRGLGPSIVR